MTFCCRRCVAFGPRPALMPNNAATSLCAMICNTRNKAHVSHAHSVCNHVFSATAVLLLGSICRTLLTESYGWLNQAKPLCTCLESNASPCSHDAGSRLCNSAASQQRKAYSISMCFLYRCTHTIQSQPCSRLAAYLMKPLSPDCWRVIILVLHTAVIGTHKDDSAGLAG